MAEKFKERSEDSFRCDDGFTGSFFDLRKNLQSKLLLCKGENPEVLTSHFDQIIADFQKLQKLLSDNAMFMPAYDIKTAQSSLKGLQEEIQQVQDSLLPKKKFSFKHRAKFGSNDFPSKGKSKIVVNPHCKAVCINTIENMVDAVIRSKKEEINGKNVSLCSMQNCKVYLPGTPGTLVISDLLNCQVFTGPVAASVYIDNCQNCTFVIACQQLRVHNSLSCIFYLHISSRTIIEDCFNLQFAPYNWTYENCDKDFVSIGLDVLENKWEAVDDFNWLVSGCPSPNWSYLPKENYSTWE